MNDLKKRACPLEIRLSPLGGKLLLTELQYQEKAGRFASSALMCGQFSSFMRAVLPMCEDFKSYRPINRYSGRSLTVFFSVTDSHGRKHEFVESYAKWMDEKQTVSILRGRFHDNLEAFQPRGKVFLKIEDGEAGFSCIVEARDLAYAVGKAATDALKKYGVYGYHRSTGSPVIEGDSIDLNALIYLKAYALELPNHRLGGDGYDGGNVKETSFADEIELLLFDL